MKGQNFVNWLMRGRAGKATMDVWDWLWGKEPPVMPPPDPEETLAVAERYLALMSQSVSSLSAAVAQQASSYKNLQAQYDNKVQEITALKGAAQIAAKTGRDRDARLTLAKVIQQETLLEQLHTRVDRGEELLISSQNRLTQAAKIQTKVNERLAKLKNNHSELLLIKDLMSSSKKSPPPIVYIAGALALAGVGYAVFGNKPNNSPARIVRNSTSRDDGQQNSEIKVAFDVPTAIPTGTVLKIGGATSMAQINQSLKMGFEKKFPGVQASTMASSSSKGLVDLAAGTIDITGISRELTAAEKSQGLVLVPIIKDQIAIIIGTNNDLRTGLRSDQIAKIFTGEFNNWSKVGGKDLPIRPILRPSTSGTHQSFQKIGLQGKNFGSGGNFKVLERGATTPMLQALGADGIGYATFAQVAKQSTVRVVAINGITPEAANYPYQRTLAYVHKDQPNDAVKAFLGFATSSEGQQLIAQQAQSK
jgi:phosphate transport system substrate-binding protein